MGRSQYSKDFLANAEKRLDALADCGSYLQVLELLRLLEATLLKCHSAKVPVQRIWMELTDGGAVFTRQHFTRAYRLFMEEKGLEPHKWRAQPRRADLPRGTLPPDRKLPASSKITQAIKELTREVPEAASSLDIFTKDL